jgi:hypothetical protein
LRSIRVLLAAVVAVAAASAAEAQSLEDKLAKKLESEFLKKAPWITDYSKALAESKKSGKPIFGYFTRSYAP